MTLTAGTRVGRYEIRSHLGSGGMGEVYRARDLTLNRDVALKFLSAHVSRDADRLRRFEQEARAASALNHPAIVAIYELGHADGQPFISMELVEGQTLRQLLGRGPLPARRALHIAAQIASALAKAHEAGIVHRDLKPDNLMVSADDHAKILDFGLAKLTGESAPDGDQATTLDHRTRSGVVLGTVGYMSPEQASGNAADSRSDQFSFGLVLYEMLTGRRPFQRATAAETLSAIIRDDVPALDPPVAAISPVRWTVERCLAKAPNDRYASTRDLARDLANVRDHLGDRASYAAVSRPARMAWRERAAWVAAVALGAAVLALVLQGSRAAPADTSPVRLTVAPPAGGTFHLSVGESPFALSPDGRHLAFVATGDKQQIWLRSFDSLESRPLAGTEGASGPFWSADGLSIGFFTSTKLKRVASAGGDVATICDARNGGGAAWNKDDVILFAPSVESALLRVAAGGGTPEPVTELDVSLGESLHVSPAFLPDGRRFLYIVLGRDNSGLYMASLDAPGRTQLAPGVSMVAAGAGDQVFFVRDRDIFAQRIEVAGRRLIGDPVLVAEDVATSGPTSAFSASAKGHVAYWSGSRDQTQLTWVHRNGAATGTVGQPGGYMNVALSPDGRLAAVDRFDTDPAVWLIDVLRGTTSRATFGNTYESTPVWAPDGKSFVFASARGGPPNLFLKRIDAAGEDERLFPSIIQVFPQHWSRDGLIAFVRVDPKTGHDVWLVSASAGGKPRPVLQTPFNEMHPRISPDGRWLAYASNESGAMGIYVTRFPEPGAKWRVSTGGGTHPVWRADSRELYYRARDGKLMAATVGAGSDFDAGVPVALFTPSATPGNLGLGTFYDVAADGRFLINMIVERAAAPPATVVLNWAPSVARVRKTP